MFTCQVVSQEFELWGKVVNEYNISIEGVQIINNTTQKISVTNCDGQFEIVARIGDSLTLNGPYLNPMKVVVKNYEKMLIQMEINKETTSMIFDNTMNSRYDNPDEEKKKLILKGRSEVTMVVDYKFEKGIPRSLDELDPKSIDTIISLSQNQALSLLGDWGKGGAVWIYTICSEK